jgi:Tol biopolymer transport system component
MEIGPGTRVGRYEVRLLLGEGGMGQVYRATDATLGRDVAIKILPSGLGTAAERLYRFEQEAKSASALNHPNILAIYDVGTHDGSPYIVSELLEGETLRDRLRIGAIPLKKAIDYAQQIVKGLAAAHTKGIIHRDLKPENLFITKDGHVKILDFGLAKLTNPLSDFASEPEADTVRLKTHPGVVMGTAGYMSPEQVRGEPADHRSDIFSFGAVFYEMLTGKRAFRGESPIEIMSAILSQEPLEPTDEKPGIVPAFERVVHHCLEKRREDRFQSTRDLAFDIESLAGTATLSVPTIAAARAASRRRTRRMWVAGAIVLFLGALAVAFFLGKSSGRPAPPLYQQLTFRRGTIYSARFASDGHTILFSASWNGHPVDIYEMRSETPESKPLGLIDAQVLAVSSTSEIAVLLNSRHLFHEVRQGTLARMSIGGGAAREILENVQEADWGPDGSLAVIRFDETHNYLEYPIGKILYTTDGYVSNPRVSPKGDMVAFLDHPVHGDSRGSVMIVNANGEKKKLSDDWAGEEGLAWSPSGDEVWFTATKTGEAQALYATTLAGKQRVVARGPVSLTLHDISRDGRLLLTGDNQSTPISGLAPNETKERDLSWLNWVRVNDLSNDGKTFVFTDFGQSSGTNYTVYLRKTDGSPAIKLGEGFGFGLSPDGKWVAAVFYSPPQIVLLPTGAGQPKRLERFQIEQYDYGAYWLPDGKSIVFVGKEPGHLQRSYVQSVDGGPPRPVTPDGVVGTLISPDVQFLLARDRDSKKAPVLWPLGGGEPRSISGLDNQDRVIRWGIERGTVYVYRQRELPLKVFKLDVATGHKQLWKEITPADPSGILGSINVLLTPDGKGYVYGFTRYLSDLYLVEELK